MTSLKRGGNFFHTSRACRNWGQRSGVSWISKSTASGTTTVLPPMALINCGTQSVARNLNNGPVSKM